METNSQLEEQLGRISTYDDFMSVGRALSRIPNDEIFAALFLLAIHTGMASDWAARMLIEIQPACPKNLPEILVQIHAASLDASNREVPFYLISQFGQLAVLQAAQIFLNGLPKDAPRSKVQAVAYWAAIPACVLCRRFNNWEAEDDTNNT